MCKYCIDDGWGTEYLMRRHLKLNGAVIAHLDVNIEWNNGNTLEVNCWNKEDDIFTYHRQINYCPMCGRKLEKRED